MEKSMEANVETINGYDILIIGGGAAGLRAAIAAAETDNRLKIALVSKVYPTRSHTVSAEGGIAAAMREYDSVENHAYDTVKGSDFLADQDAVEFFTSRAREEIITLEHWGCPWSREENGKVAVRAFGGMNVKRTVYAADKSGFYLLHSLFERSLLYENIKRFDEWYVTDLLTDDKGVTGVAAIQQKSGKIAVISAKAIIMATGGAGRVYRFTTNSALNTGDGLALAYNAGAALKDMEFVQFHPTAMAKTGILITEAARGEGGHLINKNGERFLKDYLPEKMELGPRDMVSRAILSEIRKGNGCEGPYGHHVLLDIRHLGKKTIDEKLPLVREIAINYGDTDPVDHPIAVRPAQHYTMGGIATGVDTRSTLPGLFAAGESACVTIHGANRLGSNSLSECLVFGAEAGKNAAEYCQNHKHGRSATNEKVGQISQKIKSILETEGKESTAKIRNEMQECMDHHAGILRNRESLTKGLSIIKELSEKSNRVTIKDKSLVFNTELTGLLELKSMLQVCELIFECALRREESRGAHYRTDFPARDDDKFLIHQLAEKKGKGMEIRQEKVTITKWKPEERKY
jgi:succinate dehydrogenase/fumarate reductase flavoprotein subunit